MKKSIKVLTAALALAGATAYGAKNPVSEKYALELKPTSKAQTAAVKLYKEAAGQPYVCYYKMTLKKGKAYTIWLTKESDASVKIRSAYPAEDFSKLAPIAEFVKTPCGDETRYVVSGKEWAMDIGDFDWDDDWGGDWGGDWGDEDLDWGKTPDSWTYYIIVEGKKGATATLNYIMANDVPTGVEANPLVIKPTATEASKKLAFKGKEYFVELKVKAGQRYYFGCASGKKANQLTIEDMYGGAFATYEAWSAKYNQAIQYVPETDGTLRFKVISTAGSGATGKLRFKVESARAIGKHKLTATLKAGKTVTCKPGYLNKPGSGYFDDIADECLYKFTAAKGKDYIVKTASVTRDLVLYLYDSKGKVIASNTSSGMGSKNVRVAIPAPKAKTVYYIGVCENLPVLNPPAPAYKKIKLAVKAVAKTTVGTIPLAPAPYTQSVSPDKVDKNGSDTVTLGESVWYVKFKLNGRKSVSYVFQPKAVKSVETTEKLAYKVYNSSTKKVAVSGTIGLGEAFSFKADATATYGVQISPEAGQGLDFHPFKLHSIGFISGKKCGSLTVKTEGASGAWALDSESVKYASGDSVILPTGKKTVRFGAVSGYSTPAKRAVTISSKKQSQLTVYYNDKWDPKDDKVKGATAWKLTTKKTYQKKHTLWADDAKDYYSFTVTEGYYYSFKIYGHKGDQVFDVKRADGKTYAKGVSTYVKRLMLPASKQKYYVIVRHASSATGGAYNLLGYCEKVGTVQFKTSAVTVKDTDTSVKLTVTRSAGKGALRVKYATADGTAKADDQFVKQSGYIEWKDGDKAAKTVTIKLIPKMLPVKGAKLDFTVKLADAATGKYLKASFPKGASSDKATVTITNTGTFKSAAAAYKSVYTDKAATVKESEVAPFRSGTFYGVIRENGGALSRGASELATVRFTVSAGKTEAEDTLSAKVKIADTVLTMAPGAGEPAWDEVAGQVCRKTFREVKTVCGQVCSNEMTIVVSGGDTTGSGWRTGVCEVTLKRHFASADGQSVEVGTYSGDLYRWNDKVADYLKKEFLFDGYYTVSLIPGQVLGTDRAAADSGVPMGHGYLTVSVGNTGKAKVAGLLADGSEVSLSATACGVVADANSYSKKLAMVIPIHQSDASSCFGGNIRLLMQEDKDHPDGKGYRIVADTSELLVWNVDSSNLTYEAKQGWRMDVYPVGGWYDKLANLQAYYNDHAKKFAVGAPITGFPKELLKSGYSYVTDPARLPGATEIDLVSDAFKVTGANPCSVKVAFTRATGVTSGTLKLLSANAKGKEKSVGVFNHYGVLTIDRDDCDGLEKPLADEVLDTGFMIRDVSVGGRIWKYSAPFSILATDWK